MGEQGAGDPVVARVGIEAMLESERNPVLQERLRGDAQGVPQRGGRGGTRGTTARHRTRRRLAGGARDPASAAVGDGLFLHARMDPQLDLAGALGALRALLRG